MLSYINKDEEWRGGSGDLSFAVFFDGSAGGKHYKGCGEPAAALLPNLFRSFSRNVDKGVTWFRLMDNKSGEAM